MQLSPISRDKAIDHDQKVICMALRQGILDCRDQAVQVPVSVEVTPADDLRATTLRQRDEEEGFQSYHPGRIRPPKLEYTGSTCRLP